MASAYSYVVGARIKLDPQCVGNELERIIEQNDGALTPAMVVLEARSEFAPLHPHFEWNDGIAADKYRVEQARYLIRSVLVTYERNEKPQTVRAFASITPQADGGRRFGLDVPATNEDGEEEERVTGRRIYVRIQDALSDAELRKQVLAAATREIQGWRKRYAEYREFADLFTRIDTLPLFGETADLE